AGRPLRPSKAMADVLAGGASAPASYRLLATKLQSSGTVPEAATAFTTQTVSAWAAKALADVAAMPLLAVPTRTFAPGPDLDDLFGGPVPATRPGLPPAGGVPTEPS